MIERVLDLWFMPYEDGYAARCDQHAAWRHTCPDLTSESMGRAETSLRRHHGRHLRFRRSFYNCSPHPADIL